jgi:hypothetical protein
MSNETLDEGRTGRWQRRDKRKKSARERMPKHGATLQRVYVNALTKRLRKRLPGSDAAK